MFLLAHVLLDLKILWFVFFHPEIAGNLCVLVVFLWILLKDFVRSVFYDFVFVWDLVMLFFRLLYDF